ncbi:MAG: VIT domain-containing protein, partial [Planctomycetota bacterium]|nr:VIT domain-containing protein [Planctomycetota bacterium]
MKRFIVPVIVIAVLLVLGVVVLSFRAEQKRMMVCKTNLRQLGTGTMYYMDKYGRGRYYTFPNGSGATFDGAQWIGSMYWNSQLRHEEPEPMAGVAEGGEDILQEIDEAIEEARRKGDPDLTTPDFSEVHEDFLEADAGGVKVLGVDGGFSARRISKYGKAEPDRPQRPVDAPVRPDELWIIEQPRMAASQPKDMPGGGELRAKLPDQEKHVTLPLKHTDVKAAISAYIATVNVTQKFENPYDSKIEAIYVFPLPQNAAVNEFIMTVGERRIRGIIRERKEARRIYNEARRQGHVASLLTQERPNIFT